MGQIKPPPRAHPFIAIMFNQDEQLANALKILTGRLGDVLMSGQRYRVTDFTDYYEEEFGDRLQKQFFVFRDSCTLEDFHKIKVWTNDLEIDPGSKQSSRLLNIDPGYLEPSKLVLFSSKNFSHRSYCGSGIYAEVTMYYAHGEFVRLPWTYDDYYCDFNRKFLLAARNQIVRISRNSHL